MKFVNRDPALALSFCFSPASRGETERIQAIARLLLERANYNDINLFQ